MRALAEVFKLMGDETRLRILLDLVESGDWKREEGVGSRESVVWSMRRTGRGTACRCGPSWQRTSEPGWPAN